MKYKVLDLFCGCGGISLGFELAGFEIFGGVDINSDAIRTFAHNFPDSQAKCIDLSKLNSNEILDIFKNINDVDIIIGGPPCQGFSSANRYQKESDDHRNKLFFEYMKFVELINPKVVLIENVKGILSRDNGYAKNKIYEMFYNLGYTINSQILNSGNFGVPQRRERTFFVAFKSDILFNFDDIKKIDDIITVKEAIGELYSFDNSEVKDIYTLQTLPKTHYQKYLRNNNNSILNHIIKYPAEKVQKRISYVPQGGNWKNIPTELFDNNRSNRHSSAYKRLNEKDCSVTIDTGNSHSNYFHPIYNRIPTVREAARIQSFHDGFEFLGSRTSQYRQVGNAVPPLLAKAIAKQILEVLENDK